MPASSPPIGPNVEKALRSLGARLRDHRKLLGVSATASAEAAGMSRVTLYRIEKGEPSVAIGAYLNAALVLGLEFELRGPLTEADRSARRSKPKLPRTIRLDDYPQLRRLAWQLKGKQEITPEEALDTYERNWRHLEPRALDARERDFVQRLLAAFGRERLLV